MKFFKKYLKNPIFFLFLSLQFFAATFAQATGIALIRDAETEKFLRELSIPVFRAANLNPENIRIYIVNDDSINAFVSGGQNVFVNTGLIMKYDTPDALIGVIAHEAGHVVGGHVARSSEEMQNATNTMLIGYLLGIGAALSGSPDAGTALILGGGQVAEKLFMKYSRTQEEAADKYAAQFLQRMQYPASGLVKLLEFFNEEMRAYQGQIDEYALSHPVSSKRIDFLKNISANNNFSDQKINKDLQPQMNRVAAKLEAYMGDPEYILKKYRAQNDINAKYIKSIAYHRKSLTPKALALLEEVMQSEKKDGFLYELKAQMLFESGRVSESIINYKRAIELMSARDASQAKIAFALAILTLPTDDTALVELALKNLKEAQIYESDNPFLYREFASAYHKKGDEGRSLMALAEYNFSIGDKEKTRKYAKSAKDKLDKITAKPELTRLDDLLDLAKDDEKK